MRGLSVATRGKSSARASPAYAQAPKGYSNAYESGGGKSGSCGRSTARGGGRSHVGKRRSMGSGAASVVAHYRGGLARATRGRMGCGARGDAVRIEPDAAAAAADAGGLGRP